MKNIMFYSKKNIVKYYREDNKIYIKPTDKESQFVCECHDEKTADFVISSLRHGMPRYWDYTALADGEDL